MSSRADRPSVVVYRLPQWVGRAALETILEEIARGGRAFHVLDWSGVGHVQFRAFQWFVRRLRLLDRAQQPIQLTGLTVYCAEILRFALSAQDWDFFQETAGHSAMPAGMPASRLELAGMSGCGDAGETVLPVPFPCGN